MWTDALEILTVGTGLHEPGAQSVTAPQMAARAAFGFVVLLALIRIGRRRLMGRTGTFDRVVTLLLGSTLSRGITGNAPLGPTPAACAAIVGVHWAIAAATARSARLSRWVEGEPVELLRDGVPDRSAMRRHAIGDRDLREAVRLQGKRDDPVNVELAVLETTGNISVVAEPGAQPPGPAAGDATKEPR